MPKTTRPKTAQLVSSLSDLWSERLKEFFDRVIVVEGETEARVLRSALANYKGTDGKETVRIYVSSGLSPKMKSSLVEEELRHVFAIDEDAIITSNYDRLIESFVGERKRVEISVSSVIVPEKKLAEGVLVKSTSLVWATIVDELGDDWRKAYKIPSRMWEEIVAGAFKNAGFDEVMLTPASGDHGRDVLAVKKGIGSIKIIGSVKAYKPGLLVGYDDIRALLGVMSGERSTSKGIITTTSDFPPKVMDDPFISPFLPTRLELMNGATLRKWLLELRNKR